jgi:signal transduction histidine kinase
MDSNFGEFKLSPKLEANVTATPDNSTQNFARHTLYQWEKENSEDFSFASRAELIAEINKRDRELILLHKIRAIMLTSPEISDVFQNIVNYIAEAFSFTLVSLYLIEDNALQLQAQIGYDKVMPVIELDQAISGRVARTGEPVYVPDISQDSDYIEVEAGVTSLICVPLLNRAGDSVGVLIVEAYEAHKLDERDYRLCLALADHIMLAIEQSRLYITEQRRAKQLRLLNQIGRELAASLEVSEIIEKVTGPIRRSLGYYSVNIGLVEEQTDSILYYVPKGQPGSERDYRYQIANTSLTGFVVNHNEMVVIQDVSQNALYVPIQSLPDTRSEVIIPLRSAKKVIGVLDVESDKLDDFDDDDVILLKTLADQTSIALANAQRFANIERQKTELARTNKALEEANRLKNEFLANVSHEFRTPLNSILGYVDMILSGYYGDMPEDFVDPLGRVDRNSKRLLSLINDVLDLARLEAGKEMLVLDSFRLTELVSVQYDAYHEQAVAKNLTFDLEMHPKVPSTVYNDSQRLGQLMSKLLSNAVKFTNEGGITFKISPSEADPNYFVTEIRDTGIGIPQTEFKNIFESFRQVDGSITRTFGGTGTGLAICNKLVRMMGGKIELESTVGMGSTFTVTLPLKVTLDG